MPQQALSLLPPMGQQVKIHTYLNIREDAMQLFGFLTKEDLNVFRLLIGVNGIGPKAGLNILSCLFLLMNCGLQYFPEMPRQSPPHRESEKDC